MFVCLQEAGLREGDYIVAIDGQDCKWAKHVEVVNILKSCSDRGVELSVVTLHSHESQVSKCVCVCLRLLFQYACVNVTDTLPVCLQVERRAIMLSHCSDKENTRQRLLGGSKGQSSASLLNWNRKKKREGSGVTKRQGSTFSLSFGSIRDTEAMY